MALISLWTLLFSCLFLSKRQLCHALNRAAHESELLQHSETDSVCTILNNLQTHIFLKSLNTLVY